MFSFVKRLVDGISSVGLVKHFIKELQSHRVVWNYIYMLLYIWICVYLVLKHADVCGNTVVLTTGGVVSAIFTGYVLTRHGIRSGSKADAEPNNVPSESPCNFDKDHHPDSQD